MLDARTLALVSLNLLLASATASCGTCPPQPSPALSTATLNCQALLQDQTHSLAERRSRLHGYTFCRLDAAHVVLSDDATAESLTEWLDAWLLSPDVTPTERLQAVDRALVAMIEQEHAQSTLGSLEVDLAEIRGILCNVANQFCPVAVLCPRRLQCTDERPQNEP
jgi:hypothetical protein